MRRSILLLSLLFLTACATLLSARYDSLFGPSDPTRFDTPTAPPEGESYVQTIQPILDRRCVVCHACYDAPCQLKTSSWDGLVRGANKTPVYDASRLLAATPSRLYEDAHKASEWRKRDFAPVFNEHELQTPEANRTAGLMHRMLMLKQKNPWPSPDNAHVRLDLSADRANMCPTEGEMDGYEKSTPQGGMPFGLPGLTATEHQKLTRWIEQGAPYEGPGALPSAIKAQLAQWEQFLNGNSLKEQLFARYAYEHLFLAHLYFEGDGKPHYFKLVRSATPPGKPIRLISTARPVDDPGVERVYYRLAPERETIVTKTHMPYVLNAQRMARWRELFFTQAYTVSTLPGYNADTAANPFATFAALPASSRYRFMLDEAEFTIMGFIKGPVCRGQLALNVIDDNFWVTFLAPSEAYDTAIDKLLQEDNKLMRLPTGKSSSDLLVSWIRYGELASDYHKARSALVNATLKTPENLTLEWIWDGDGRNDNAALSIFRHFDSASVVKGLVGDTPKTAWVIGYPLLERIHYLLVANYDVYGNAGHQVNSRMFMDYLRAEGEFSFLLLLPKADRIAVRDAWYRDTDLSTREQVYGGPNTTINIDSGIRYKTQDTKQELLDMIRQRLKPVLNTRLDWKQNTPPALQAPLRTLAATRGKSLQWLPENSIMVVDLPDGKALTYSLIRNTAHSNVSHLLGESMRLRPDEDTLTLTPGIVGSYPNAFYKVSAADLPALTAELRKLGSEGDYAAFARRWAVRRDNPDFWAFSDALLDRQQKDEPIAAGILDYNRMEYR